MRHSFKSIIAIGIVVGGASPLAKGSAYDRCMQSAVATYDMLACQKTALAEADVRLNVAFRQAMAALAADQQDKLRVAERAWIVFRDADCSVFYGKETGTMAGVQGGDCMIGHTEQRIVDLAAFSQS